MGFFDEMLAGGLAGAGKGMVDYAATREREDEKRTQLEAQMQLKREMLADQLASKKELAEMRFGAQGGGSGGSGSGGGKSGGGSFFENMMRSAKTPEEQSAVIREAGMRAGPEAAAALAEYYGKPMQQTVTEFDPAQAELMSRRDYAEANPDAQATKTSTRAVDYDKQKGADALNRLIAMADPAKYDDYTKGERGAKLNTNADAAGAAIKDPIERAATVQSLSNPASDQRKIDAQVEMNDARIAAKKVAGGGKGVGSANTIFKTVTDESGNVMGVKRDGTTVDLGIKSDSFNKQVSALVTKMNDNEGGGFRKLPEDQKRAKATERLLGSVPPANAAPAADRMSQFKVIR